MQTAFKTLSIAVLLAFAPKPSFAQISVADLRASLHETAKRGHQAIPYNQTDEALAEVFADPAVPGNLILFYTGRSQDVGLWVNQNAEDGWNREHLWARSRGVRPMPMNSDLHNLMPTDASVNQRRSHLDFDDGGAPEGEAPATFLDGDSFEPRDAVKGDVARALFYMDIRYEGTDGEPDLILVERTTPSGGHTIGHLCTLLEWHQADPTTSEEVARNNQIEAVQGNRNPFSDDQDLALRVYGEACGVTTAVPLEAPLNSLSIGTWNIANLHHESGVALRGGSGARDDIDYSRLAAVAADLDLDIVALQEIGSPAALARVFPTEDYHLVMSSRYRAGDEGRPAEERDIFTAMAFSKAKFPTAPSVETLSALRIDHVGFDRDGTPSIRPTRAAMITELTIDGHLVKVLNVHLKSGCHGWSLDPVVDQSPMSQRPFRSRFDCRTLKAQRAILENWLEQQATQDIPTIVLGDFNRRLNATNAALEEIDDFWLTLNDGTPEDLSLVKGPIGPDAICWPQHAKRFVEHIDFIVIDALLRDFASPDAPVKHSMGFEDDARYADRSRQRLSDHCPVSMTLRW